MAHGPRYRLSMRRRREGKTNYQRRLRLILSGKNRLVIRASTRNTIVQVMEATLQGDKTLVSANSFQLEKKFGWKYFTGNLPSAYLTGYLCGINAKKAGIEDCILDLGIFIHRHRIIAAFKGFLDAGISVPHSEKFFATASLKDRIKGQHIQNYAEKLFKEDTEKYEKVFSKLIQDKVDPKKITSEFDKTIKKIKV